MLQVSEHRGARPRIGKGASGKLSQAVCLRYRARPNQLSPTLGMAGVEAGFHGRRGGFHGGRKWVASTAA